MTKQDLKIVYMGTPDFAVESLKCLVEGGYNVVAVVTMPDKPMGRHGSVLQPSPVKQYAVEHGLKVMQPVKLKDPEFVEELRSLNADIQIVVAFRMLPEVVWSMPPLGTFNAHASLLPKYRGAAPINWAVINGETETGVTTFFLKHEIDTGDVIQQVRIPIAETDNVEIVHNKLMQLSGQLVVETVDNIIAGTVKAIPQDHLADASALIPAPKIFRETCRIDWQQPVKKVYDFIRGLSPYPSAWTELVSSDGKVQSVKIFEAQRMAFEEVAEDTSSLASLDNGSIVCDGKSGLLVKLVDGILAVQSLQIAGKKRMAVVDFLRGYKIGDTDRFC